MPFLKMNNLQIITLDRSNITDFAKERNLLLKKSKSDWILFLDSDEKMSKELEKEILDLKQGSYSGFYIKRRIIFLGKETGEDQVLRLAKKGSGNWIRKVHETWKIKGKVRTLKNYIIHTTATNVYDYIEKINSYSSIHAVENLKEGKRVSLFKVIFYPKIKFVQNILMGGGSSLASYNHFIRF